MVPEEERRRWRRDLSLLLEAEVAFDRAREVGSVRLAVRIGESAWLGE